MRKEKMIFALPCCGVWVLAAAFAKETEINLELDGGGAELGVAVEQISPEMAGNPAPSPKTIHYWNFDEEKPDSKGLPSGWWAGVWGDRKASFGSEEGYGGMGRSMKIDVRYIVGGTLQIFSPGWVLLKGDYYRISFKARGFDHPGGFNIQVREIPVPWRSFFGVCSVKLTNEWKEYSFGGFAKADAKPGQFGILIGVNEAGCFAVDDVRPFCNSVQKSRLKPS